MVNREPRDGWEAPLLLFEGHKWFISVPFPRDFLCWGTGDVVRTEEAHPMVSVAVIWWVTKGPLTTLWFPILCFISGRWSLNPLLPKKLPLEDNKLPSTPTHSLGGDPLVTYHQSLDKRGTFPPPLERAPPVQPPPCLGHRRSWAHSVVLWDGGEGTKGINGTNSTRLLLHSPTSDKLTRKFLVGELKKSTLQR